LSSIPRQLLLQLLEWDVAAVEIDVRLRYFQVPSFQATGKARPKITCRVFLQLPFLELGGVLVFAVELCESRASKLDGDSPGGE
jgi:hypothetical protein